MKSSEEWARLGGGVIAALAVAAALAVLGPRLLGAAAGPEAEIITVLKRLEREGLRVPLPGVSQPLISRKLQYARLSVSVAPGGERAEVFATLDFTGGLGATEVSSLGVERVAFVRRDRQWTPEQGPAPRLVAVVRALEARRRALEAGDTAALQALAGEGREGGGAELARVLALRQRRYRAEGWYLRLEREEAVVTERWRLEGALPERPVDERGERRLELNRRGDEFLFSAGLM